MNIGENQRTIEVEPLEAPEDAPIEAPAEPAREEQPA